MEIGVKYYFTIRYNASSVAILMKHVSLLISSAKDKDDQFSEFLSSLASDPPSPMLEDFNFTSGEFLSLFLFGIIYSAFSINVNVSHVNANYAVTQQVSVLKKNLLLLPPQIHLVLLYQAHQKIRYTEYH